MAIDKEKLKRTLDQWIVDTQDAAREFFDDFKSQTKYFKARVGIVAGFALLVLATFIIAPSPSEENACNAHVVASDLGWKTVIEVANESGSDYDVFAVLVEGEDIDEATGISKHGAWRMQPRRLAKGRSFVVEARHLRDNNGSSPGINFKPNVVEVSCNTEKYRTQVTLRERK